MSDRLKDIAARIDAHLKRFEADTSINRYPEGHPAAGRGDLRPYYQPGAWFYRGARIAVRYIAYQGVSHLTKADALRYLEKLDGGFVGRHFEALRQ